MPDSLLFTADTEIYSIDLRKVWEVFDEGIVDADDLEVTAGGTGLSVDVNSGTAFVEGDAVPDQGLYRVHLDTPQNSDAFVTGAIEPADATDPRVDRIILQVFDDESDGSGDTAWYLTVLTGTPTAGADLTNEDGAQAVPDTALLLATVLIEVGDTAVNPANIEDDRVLAGPAGGSGGIAETLADAKGDVLVATGPDVWVALGVGADDEVLIADSTTTEGVRWGAAAGGVDPEMIDNAGDLFVGDGDNIVSTLPVGADGEFLVVNSAAPLGIEWTSFPEVVLEALVNAQGDLIVGDADNTPAILSVGADDEVLIADSGETLGVKWGSRLPSRLTVQVTTASLADLAEASATFAMALSFRLLRIETDIAARVRLYATSADRTADAARPVGTDPTGDHGVILDHVTTVGDLDWRMSPVVDGSSMEASPSANISALIQNRSGLTDTVQVTLTFVPTEA